MQWQCYGSDKTVDQGRGERGAALVEFALALPMLLVVLAGIVDFGFVFQRYEVITNAAREGAGSHVCQDTTYGVEIAGADRTCRRASAS